MFADPYKMITLQRHCSINLFVASRLKSFKNITVCCDPTTWQKTLRQLLVSLAYAARLIIFNAFFAPPAGSPLYKLYGYVRRVCFFFQQFWSELGYQFRPFWPEIGYGLYTLVLNWVCFLEGLITSSSFGDKTNYRVRAVTACRVLRSRAGLQGFRK